MKREKLAAVFFAAVILLGFAAAAGAVDGTIEINQAKVLAKGGFPYTIAASGSYRLTGNLTVPASKDGIDVGVSNVTIDLNGFSITGSGSTLGINSEVETEVTVKDGTITGFGIGVALGGNSIVKSVHADSNSSDGIFVQQGNTVIEGCTANSNGLDGIFCEASGCTISGNSVNGNVGVGIFVLASGGLILRNTINGASSGINASDATTGYGENVLNGNGTPVTGGTSMKNNVCNGVLC
jgi:parallel beta-helix repeat protein